MNFSKRLPEWKTLPRAAAGAQDDFVCCPFPIWTRTDIWPGRCPSDHSVRRRQRTRPSPSSRLVTLRCLSLTGWHMSWHMNKLPHLPACPAIRPFPVRNSIQRFFSGVSFNVWRLGYLLLPCYSIHEFYSQLIFLTILRQSWFLLTFTNLLLCVVCFRIFLLYRSLLSSLPSTYHFDVTLV